MKRVLTLGAAAVLLAGCGTLVTHPAAARLSVADLARLTAESRPTGIGARFRPAVRGPEKGGCHAALGARYGVHIELFAADRVVMVPRGIGVTGPRRLDSGRIIAARCFGALSTVDPTGLVLIAPGRPWRLADIFAEWGQRLTATGLAGFDGRVRTFVNGRRWIGNPADVPLSRHTEIALEVGPEIPPHASYDFPAGT